MRILYDPTSMLVSVPPRHGKSMLISRWTPLWFLTQNPSARIGVASYSEDYTKLWGRSTRQAIETLPELGIRLAKDKKSDGDWETTRGGGMLSTGVGGVLTGRGCGLLIIDDPIKNWVEANSEVTRESIWGWFCSTALTRVEPGGSLVILMTRWHSDDLIGRLLRKPEDVPAELQRDWENFVFRALAEDDDPLGREEGAELWPKRFSRKELWAIRATVGPQRWSAMYQQRPAPKEGFLFRTEWWQFWDDCAEEAGGLRVRAWDLAASVHRGDWTVGLQMYRDFANDAWVVTDVIREQLLPGDVVDLIRDTAIRDGFATQIDIPQDPGQAGKAQTDHLRRMLPGYTVNTERETGNKETRASGLSSEAQRGRIAVLRRDWTQAFVAELADFPVGRWDDQVDAASRAFYRLIRAEQDTGVAAPQLYHRAALDDGLSLFRDGERLWT